MTSKFNNTETMTTMRRLGKAFQKTTNISTSKRYGGTRTHPEQQRAEQAKKIYRDRLPLPLRPRDQAKDEKDGKKEGNSEMKDMQMAQGPGQEQSLTSKKEETSYDMGASEMDQSDDERRKKEMRAKEKFEEDLSQIIHISISETPTNIMYYCPSTKYLTIKNGKKFKIFIIINIILFHR